MKIHFLKKHALDGIFLHHLPCPPNLALKLSLKKNCYFAHLPSF
jgi:hypothetical protein